MDVLVTLLAKSTNFFHVHIQFYGRQKFNVVEFWRTSVTVETKKCATSDYYTSFSVHTCETTCFVKVMANCSNKQSLLCNFSKFKSFRCNKRWLCCFFIFTADRLQNAFLCVAKCHRNNCWCNQNQKFSTKENKKMILLKYLHEPK